MKTEKLFKYLSFTLFTAIAGILMVATIVEKKHGTDCVLENIYHADWMIALWAVATLSALVYIMQRKLHRQPATLCLHLSFAVILAGANDQISVEGTYCDPVKFFQRLRNALLLNDVVIRCRIFFCVRRIRQNREYTLSTQSDQGKKQSRCPVSECPLPSVHLIPHSERFFHSAHVVISVFLHLRPLVQPLSLPSLHFMCVRDRRDSA
jgi:hypothetical protein